MRNKQHFISSLDYWSAGWRIGLLVFIGLFLTPTPLFAKTSPPTLTIASPKDGETILGESITLAFVAGNLTYKNYEESKKNAPNEGHLHLWLDKKNPSRKNTQEIITHDDFYLKLPSPGNHILTLEVVKNDHSSYSPPLKKTVNFASFLPAPLPSPSPTPIPNPITTLLTKEVIFSLLGLLSLIIGFLIYLIFGRKKFF